MINGGSMDSGQWTIISGEWRVEMESCQFNGQWTMEVESGCSIDNGYWIVES
jgi:hypothetical protein